MRDITKELNDPHVNQWKPWHQLKFSVDFFFPFIITVGKRKKKSPKLKKQKYGHNVEHSSKRLVPPKCKHSFHLSSVSCSTSLETWTSKKTTLCFATTAAAEATSFSTLSSALHPDIIELFCNSCFHGNVNQVILRKEEEEKRRWEGVRKLVGNSLSVREV